MDTLVGTFVSIISCSEISIFPSSPLDLLESPPISLHFLTSVIYRSDNLQSLYRDGRWIACDLDVLNCTVRRCFDQHQVCSEGDREWVLSEEGLRPQRPHCSPLHHILLTIEKNRATNEDNAGKVGRFTVILCGEADTGSHLNPW